MKGGSEKGFTLIEVILALVVSSILAVMLSTYLGSGITRVNDPISRLRKTMAIYSVMENIHTTYENSTDVLSTLKTNVGDSTGNPHTNDFGTYNVKYNEYVACDASSTTSFSGPSGTTTLMITITDPDTPGITVTSLFAD